MKREIVCKNKICGDGSKTLQEITDRDLIINPDGTGVLVTTWTCCNCLLEKKTKRQRDKKFVEMKLEKELRQKERFNKYLEG